ncbi:MAG: hypothetical protein A3F10_00845 [Coxiella sp. RIFCSPHIGHO2_12_FULL_42_15]|nr:MAG: hypothetical protein A3F10_00845 [Coxiella sp. RIFCSPHIGHO2_12_FULL_42_15]
MKKLIAQAAVSLLVSGAVATAFAGGPDVPAPMVTPGLYLGLGGSWNTVDESTGTIISASANNATAAATGNLGGTTGRTAWDQYDASQNRLAPMAQLGYWAPIDNEWLWGIVAQWKYLGYKTQNENTSRGQFLDNATANPVIFATAPANVSSQTRVNNEVLLLVYFGAQYDKGYFYLGLGPALFTAYNAVYANGITTGLPPAGPNTFSPSVSTYETMWGGAAQLGYNYYFKPTWFLGFNYTYALSGTYNFGSSADQAAFESGTAANLATLNFSRNVQITIQEVMFSINKVFEM